MFPWLQYPQCTKPVQWLMKIHFGFLTTFITEYQQNKNTLGVEWDMVECRNVLISLSNKLYIKVILAYNKVVGPDSAKHLLIGSMQVIKSIPVQQST